MIWVKLIYLNIYNPVIIKNRGYELNRSNVNLA